MCDPIPGITAGPLKTLFTLRLSVDKIDYAREVLRPTGETQLGVTERGTGAINSEGELVLTGTAKGQNFSSEASYRGKFTGSEIHLTGTQIWTYMGRSAPHTRPCTIDLKRSN